MFFSFFSLFLYQRRIERWGPATLSFSCGLKTKYEASYSVNVNVFQEINQKPLSYNRLIPFEVMGRVHIQAKARATPEWVPSSLQGPIWAFVGSVTSAVLLAPYLTTRTPSMFCLGLCFLVRFSTVWAAPKSETWWLYLNHGKAPTVFVFSCWMASTIIPKIAMSHVLQPMCEMWSLWVQVKSIFINNMFMYNLHLLCEGCEWPRPSPPRIE